ncbi:hypothetical protein Clacol_008910 [Clathrus columnatus]|uniref:Nudix hydrolase domain-containing protein n=1 Tax=Clathrus columnatus TaxID=1419009 RepID=A0AAV5ANC4_9AGAM|nr:hypothetical protein Clacol_008910 [Clathrus columnatus]
MERNPKWAESPVSHGHTYCAIHEMMVSSRSFAAVINRCDNFRRETAPDNFIDFRLSPSSTNIIGLVSEDVFNLLQAAHQEALLKGIPTDKPFLSFNPRLDTAEKRSEALKDLVEKWRDNGLFANIIAPNLWRNELYTVYVDPFGPHTEDRVAFALERTACAIFGLVTYGVHMTMYTSDWKIWVPTRSKTKQTWPLCLDNSVAGGIPHGFTPFESLIKECEEEASLDASLVKAHAIPCGAVSYYFRSEKGYLQPEVQYIYDLLIPPGKEDEIIPRPKDGEVDSFKLENVDAVVEKMHGGLFKPNCALGE